MAITTKSGQILTEADLDGLDDEAEAGYDLSTWRPRPIRPPFGASGTRSSARISVRIPAAVRARVQSRAAREGRSISDVLRSLLEDYARGLESPR